LGVSNFGRVKISDGRCKLLNHPNQVCRLSRSGLKIELSQCDLRSKLPRPLENTIMKNLLLSLICLLAATVVSAQNVGIGATTFTPASSALLELRSTNSGFLMPKMTAAQMNAISGPTEGLMVYQTNVTKGFKYYDGSAWASFGGAADNFGNHVAGQNIRLNDFWLSNDGGNEGIRITNDGKVGVGVAVPTYPFELSSVGVNAGPISSTDQILARFEQSSTSRGGGIQIKGTRALSQVSAFIDLLNYDENVPNEYIMSRVAGLTEDNGERGALVLYTNGGGTSDSGLTEKMRINSNGNVGIGTITPSKALDVVSSASNSNVMSVRSTASNGWSSVDFMDQSGSLSATFGFANSGTTGIFTNRAYMNSYNHDFVLTRNSSENSIFISGSNGNVGIGTSSPAAKLDVNGDVRITDLAGSGTRMVIADANGDLSTQAIPSGGGGGFGSGTTLNLNLTSNITNQNVSGVSIIRLSANGNREIQGLTGGVAGQVICIVNTDSNDHIKFKKDTGTQQFRDELEVNKEEGAIIMYDGSYWYVLSKH